MVFKHYNFELIWESMVEKYLNLYFVGIQDGMPVFDISSLNKIKKFVKETFHINKLHPKHKIEPDHYYIENTNQYIFDSKYYFNLKRIDYKQIAYNTILKSRVEGETFNVLLLPTSEDSKSELFFELKEKYYTKTVDKVSIIATFLNMKDVIETYNIQS